MSLSSWSIRHPAPTLLLFLLLTLAGLAAFRVMPVQGFPDIDVPIVSVSLRLPGAAPAQLETEVVRPVEDAIATLTGLKHVESRLNDGRASVRAEFHLDKPTAEAVEDVRDAVSRVRGELPAELLDPVVRRVEFTGALLLAYTLQSSRRDPEALSWFIDDEVTRALRGVRGVGEVTRVGGVSRQVRVELDPMRLVALGITPAEVSRQLRAVQRDATGGRSDLDGREHALRLLASATTADALAATEIALADGRVVRLDRLGVVGDGVSEPRAGAWLGGEPVVGVEVSRQRGHGDVDIAQRVRAVMAELQAQHPDLVVTEAVDFVETTVDNFEGSLWLLAEGALLAVAVVLMFLRDGRATFIAAVALPLSVIPTFAAMHLAGFTLNIVTLLALSLVVGVLVDDAIVEIENIERHRVPGVTPRAAAMLAADEIGLAVVATTLALVAVFLPTAFMGGEVGRFFVQFGWTAAFAVLCSLLVARMLTPMMCARLLRPPAQAPRTPRWVERCVAATAACLRRRGLTLAGLAVLVAASAGLASQLPGSFIPASDDDWTQVRLTTAPGSPLRDTAAAAQHARQLLAPVAEVQQVYTTIGAGSAGVDPVGAEEDGADNVRTAVLTLRLRPRAERPGRSKQHIEQDLRRALEPLPGTRVRIGRGDDSQGYELALVGADGELLAREALRLAHELQALPGIGSVTSSASLLRPELAVRPDFARAAQLGVTSEAIAETLRVATAGDHETQLARLNLDDRQVPVLVRLADVARDDLPTLRQLPVRGALGPVPLANVAEIEIASGPGEITRHDRLRDLRLYIEPDGPIAGDLEDTVAALPGLQTLAPGIRHAGAGDAESKAELMTGFALAMAAGIGCVYAVLVLLLGSFALPLTILGALVLSVPGAVLALRLTGTALSMPSLIGLVMLMGIVAKNAILLVDYIVIARRDHGLAREAAVLDACRKRTRPIVMTSLAMGAGMLPIALGIGTDPAFRAPMAIVVIGGLLSSTVFSLLAVPVIYSVVDDIVARARGWGRA